MGDPVITPQLLAAAGAGVGALMKPRNPLQGALLGGIAGYTGGSLYGASQVAAPTAASAITPTQSTLLGMPQPAISNQSVGTLLGTNPAITSQAAAPVTAAQRAALGTQQMVNAVSPSGVGIGTGGFEGMKKFGYENPGLMMTGLSSTKELLTPEQMPSPAPAMPLQAGRGVKPYDFVAAMDPYKQSVIGSPQISLLG